MKLMHRLFLEHVGQTSDRPLMIGAERAEGIYIYTPEGKRYTDLISGVSVSNVGHANPRVVEAVCRQAKEYMHLMVYGELVESPQVRYARRLAEQLPGTLDSVYFVNSGSEAVEGALKLAKRCTGRTELVSFKNAYHGSTHGALSMMGDEGFKNAFRPLLADVRQLDFNDIPGLEALSERTAAVIVEPVQGEGGYRLPAPGFLEALRRRCDETGALLIFDEIQTGFGRTGHLFACQRFGVFPDILVLAKAMGGGMPLGGFVAPRRLMDSFKTDPPLGHITTFGGHPVCCAAGLAALDYILDEKLPDGAEEKAELFASRLVHPAIREIRRCGLMLAVEFGDAARTEEVVSECIRQGILTESFLFCNTALRIAPPLIINRKEIEESCSVILSAVKKAFR